MKSNSKTRKASPDLEILEEIPLKRPRKENPNDSNGFIYPPVATTSYKPSFSRSVEIIEGSQINLSDLSPVDQNQPTNTVFTHSQGGSDNHTVFKVPTTFPSQRSATNPTQPGFKNGITSARQQKALSEARSNGYYSRKDPYIYVRKILNTKLKKRNNVVLEENPHSARPKRRATINRINYDEMISGFSQSQTSSALTKFNEYLTKECNRPNKIVKGSHNKKHSQTKILPLRTRGVEMWLARTFPHQHYATLTDDPKQAPIVEESYMLECTWRLWSDAHEPNAVSERKCGLKFNSNYDFSIHVFAHYLSLPVQWRSVQGENGKISAQFQCSDCAAIFYDFDTLTTHRRLAHAYGFVPIIGGSDADLREPTDQDQIDVAQWRQRYVKYCDISIPDNESSTSSVYLVDVVTGMVVNTDELVPKVQPAFTIPSIMSLGTLRKRRARERQRFKEIIRCPICPKVFCGRNQLMLHLERNHVHGKTPAQVRAGMEWQYVIDAPYKCQACQFQSSLYTDLHYHFKEAHKSQAVLFCPLCLFYVKPKPVDCAVKFKNGMRTYALKDMNIMQVLADLLVSHITKHAQTPVKADVKCMNCQLIFLTNIAKLSHFNENHKRVCTKFPQFTNDVCHDFSFNNKPCHLSSSRHLGPLDFDSKLKIAVPLSIIVEQQRVNDNLCPLPLDIDKVLCLECRLPLGEGRHFTPYLIHCSLCKFTTHCNASMKRHFTSEHLPRESIESTGEIFKKHTDNVLERQWSCACGFVSYYGNELTTHLIKCDESNLTATCCPDAIKEEPIELTDCVLEQLRHFSITPKENELEPQICKETLLQISMDPFDAIKDRIKPKDSQNLVVDVNMPFYPSPDVTLNLYPCRKLATISKLRYKLRSKTQQSIKDMRTKGISIHENFSSPLLEEVLVQFGKNENEKTISSKSSRSFHQATAIIDYNDIITIDDDEDEGSNARNSPTDMNNLDQKRQELNRQIERFEQIQQEKLRQIDISITTID